MVAMRELSGTTGNTLYYLHGDHLGSTSTTTCGNTACGTLGAVLARQSYYPYGGVRVAGNLPTDHTFTGQIEDDSTGLYFYNARYYSGSLGRFVSADSIVPGAGNPQAFNRYSYSLSNPINYTDPSGHYACGDGEDQDECGAGGSAAGRPAPKPAPRLTNEQYIMLIVYAESSDGSYPAEAIRRIAWVAWNRVAKEAWRGDAFDIIDQTWGSNGAKPVPPTWTQTMAYFTDGYDPNKSADLLSLHTKLTSEDKRSVLSDVYNAYSSDSPRNYRRDSFKAVMDIVQNISNGLDSDPTGGNTGLYATSPKPGVSPEDYALQIEANNPGSHAYAFPPGSMDYRYQPPNSHDWYGTILVTHWK